MIKPLVITLLLLFFLEISLSSHLFVLGEPPGRPLRQLCRGNKLPYGLSRRSAAAHWGCQMNKLWRGRKQRGGLVNCLINSLQPHSSAWWQGCESSCSWWCWGVPLWLPSVAPSSSCSSTNMEFVSGMQQWECSGSSAGCCHPRVV